MNRLKNKNIYYIITGAKKAELSNIIIDEMILEGAKVFVIPTKSSANFIKIDDFKNINNCKVKTDWSEQVKLPKEDAILVAPCTFNTLNAIAAGLASTYPLCLVASGIGNKTPIFIAPAMNRSLWENPITKDSIKKLEEWGCHVIWPEISETNVTMIDSGKILDTLCSIFLKINYLPNRLCEDNLNYKLQKYQRKYLKMFRALGKKLNDDKLNYSTAGCLSLKVPGGILISTSGSELMNLSVDNLSLIISWDKDKNTIDYVGNLLPSSESPLHCVLHESHKKKMVLHVHCPKITYSENLNEYKTSNYERYGTFSIGFRISEIIRREKFAIMKYHGQVLIGDSRSELLNILYKFKKLV